MEKNLRDTIVQATQGMLNSAKDVTATNIIASCRRGELKIEGDQIEKLLLVVNSSIEEGFNRARNSFSRVVEQTVTSSTLAVQTKKK